MDALDIKRKVWTDPRYFIGYGLGTGLMPKMPGTWGTLMAIPLYLVLAKFDLLTYLIIVALIGFYAVKLSDTLSKEVGVHDDPGMNIDEFVGYFVTMIGAPIAWWAPILGFAYFRLFDIWKPWPIRWVDHKVQGGFGMILDDVIAGLFSLIALKLCAWAIMTTLYKP